MGQSKVPIAEATITVSTASIGISGGFSAAELAAARLALVTVHTDAIFYKMTGAAATADTNSHKMAVDTTFQIDGNASINNLRMIRETNDAAVKVTLYK